MNNQDRATEVIRTWQKRHKNIMDKDPDWAAQNLAIDLYNAGVLAPDLPEPSPGSDGALLWNNGTIWVEDDEDTIYTDTLKSLNRMTPDKARDFALAVLAVSTYKDKKA